MNNGKSNFLYTLFRQYWFFPLILLIIAIAVNASLQETFFKPIILNGLLRTALPYVLLSAGQAIVILGGGIDLSVGAIVAMVNVILVTQMGADASPEKIAIAVAIGLLAGTLAGVVNGLSVAYFRFQPLVTTFATTFIFTGVALWVLPRPGGTVPDVMMKPFRAPIVYWLPTALIILTLLAWIYLRSTRYGRYLYASGGNPKAAYMSAVPVDFVRFSTYVISGFMASLVGLMNTMSFGTGSALIGPDMTLQSIVAVVLGGTALSGGAGGVGGTIIGVFILSIIRGIISFSSIPTWWQQLVQGAIIILALTGPGLIALFREGFDNLMKSYHRRSA